MRRGFALLCILGYPLKFLAFRWPLSSEAWSTNRGSVPIKVIASDMRPTLREKQSSHLHILKGVIDDDRLELYDNGDAYDDGEGYLDASRYAETDWMEAELTLREAPSEPHPDLDPYRVALTVCRSLQWVDYPEPAAGLVRCFPFLTFECRKAVTARQGGDSPDRFARYGLLSSALQPLMGATRVAVGAATLTPAAPPLRGELASLAVDVTGAPVAALQHLSGLPRGGVAVGPPRTHLVMRLERQRRPPHQDCWLVRELMDVRQAFAGDSGNAGVAG